MVGKLHLNRNIKIDITKGLLITLVVIGHLLLGKLNDNMVRYIIYSFHMPIFLLVSGYLVNVQRLEQENLSGLFRKYFSRLIIPWAIAVIIYSLIEYKYAILGKGLYILYHPIYHLWYVPAFLSYVFCTYFLVRSGIQIKTILLILVPITIFLNFIYISPGVNNYINSNLLSNISYIIRPQFYFYFILGIFLKNNLKVIEKYNLLYFSIVLILFGFINILMFFMPTNNMNKLISAVVLIIQNSLIGLMIVRFLNSGKSLILKNKKMKTYTGWLGKESLGIYLWHVLPLILAKYLFSNSPQNYYVSSVVLLIILLGIIYLMDKSKFLKKYFLGKI